MLQVYQVYQIYRIIGRMLFVVKVEIVKEVGSRELCGLGRGISASQHPSIPASQHLSLSAPYMKLL